MKGAKNKAGLKIVILAASSLTIMSSATIAPALPEISEHFKNAPNGDILSRLVLTFPALFIAITAPFAGFILDKSGRVKPIIAGLALYALAGAAGFFINNLFILLVTRAFLGIAVAFIMSGCTTLIGDYFQGVERNKMMGIQGAVMAGGGVIYILAGGALATISWRGPFLIYLLSIILIPLTLKFLFEPIQHNEKQNLITQEKEPIPVITIAFLFTVGFTGMLLFYMIPVNIPFLLQKMQVNTLLTGIAIASSTIVGAFVSALYQKIKTKLTFMSIYALTFFFMGTGFWLISNANSLLGVITGLVVNGLGMGSMMPNSSTWLMTITPVTIRGRIVGGMTMAIFTGQFLSAIILQPLISRAGVSGAFYYTGLFMLGLSGIFLFFSFIFYYRTGK